MNNKDWYWTVNNADDYWDYEKMLAHFVSEFFFLWTIEYCYIFMLKIQSYFIYVYAVFYAVKKAPNTRSHCF